MNVSLEACRVDWKAVDFYITARNILMNVLYFIVCPLVLVCVHSYVLATNINIIQLMHSFEVNIRICQPENSDVHRGEAEVNITFEG